MHTITNSERSSAACPQRWLIQYGIGLRTVGRTRVLDLGSLVHEGLQAYFGTREKHGTLQDALDAIDKYHASEVKKHKEAANSGLIDAGSYVSQTQLDDLAEAAQNAKQLMGSYHMTWTNAPFELVHNEQTLSAAVRKNAKRKSTRTRFGGKIDKVVNYNGRTFIVEHKTTSLPLYEWLEKHRRSPQARSYAWLLSQHGIEVDGVIYDLIQSKPPKAWDSLAVLKDGKRLAKVNGLIWTTAEEFLIAVKQVGLTGLGREGTLDDCDWYRETYDALLARDNSGFWLRREVELFAEHEMERIGAELYRAATDIRRWRDTMDQYRETIDTAAKYYPDKLPVIVEDILHDVGSEFPRESGICWQYNRICHLASLCGSWSRYDVQGFTVAGNGGHTELDADALDSAGGQP
jgi:hypothetical protein